MTATPNLGFSAVILIGAAGYALTGALVLTANRLRASMILRSAPLLSRKVKPVRHVWVMTARGRECLLKT